MRTRMMMHQRKTMTQRIGLAGVRRRRREENLTAERRTRRTEDIEGKKILPGEYKEEREHQERGKKGKRL